MFLFGANATGVVAQFQQPVNEVIPVLAASALGADGGLGRSRVDGFRHNFLSFQAAYVAVRGEQAANGEYVAVAESVIEGFSLLGVVTCDRIVGKLTGTFPADLTAPSECSIVPTGSVFERLRIGDTFFERLEVAPDFFCAPEHAYWSGLLGALNNPDDYRILESRSLLDGNGDRVPLPAAGKATTLLGFGIAIGAPLQFTIPDFGTVHLGEFFCGPTYRRLIMLRIELNGAVQGSVVVGDPIVQPGPYPP
jgi:hypothetical protein